MKNENIMPLTHPQKRIWYVEKINPEQPVHNIGGIVRIGGEVNFTFLQSSINHFLKNNTGIRHRFVEKNGEVMQYVSEYSEHSFPNVDFDNEDELYDWVSKEAAIAFKLDDADLYKFIFFTVKSTGESGYFVKVHHIISDGWSMNILSEKIVYSYTKYLKGEDIPSYVQEDYKYCIQREKEYLSSKRFEKNKKFWNEKFQTLTDKPEKTELECAPGTRKAYQLTKSQTEGIKNFAENQNVSVYSCFVALYYLYLHKTTKKNDFVVGMPLLNRSGKIERSIVGMLTSTMPFRHQIHGNMTIEEVVKGINSELMKCYFHQKYPYDLLVQDLELNKKEYGDLFDTCINYYNTSLPTDLEGMKLKNEEFYNGNQIYNLQLIIREWTDTDQFSLEFDYKLQKYEENEIEMMFHCMTFLVEQVVESPDKKLIDLQLIPDEFKNQLLYKFNATDEEYPQEKTIYELFEEQVEESPQKVALSIGKTNLTYGELNVKANQLARYLIKKDVKKGSIVGIATEHSFETIIGILAVLKAGGAYLPIDPTYPSERINYMVTDSDMNMLLTNVEASKLKITNHVEVIDLRSNDLYLGKPSNVEHICETSDLAYIIYTSGSTGKPKGTMITHKGLVNYTTWGKKKYIGFNKNEVFPLYSSLAFDLTITSIFTPLISGCQIVIYPPDGNEYVLYKIIREKRATIIKLTPSHLSLLLDEDLEQSCIRKIIVGGENLSVNLAKLIQEKFGVHTKIYNEYGPTETVVGCMIHQFDAHQDQRISVPIGKPIQNTQIYLLDKDLQPVPFGSIGEIYVSGEGVANGYLNRPDLTLEKFSNNPFIPGKRMYKTGDLAKFIDSDNIEYLRREDDQIKIRGFRIETTEIEHCLRKHPNLKETLVMKRQDADGTEYLCAYFTGSENISSTGMFNFLTGILPAYMIPSSFVQLEAFPLTINAKIDRDALPNPDMKHFKSLSTEADQALVNVISEVLDMKEIDINDNFYHLGGDSIKAIQIGAKLSEKGMKLKTKDILSNPVIKDMALYIETANEKLHSQKPCEGVMKPLPSTAWFFEQEMLDMNHYTQSVLLELSNRTDLEVVVKAIELVAANHDSFRLNYRKETNELFFNKALIDHKLKMEFHDISALSSNEQIDFIGDIGELTKSSIQVEHDYLLKGCIFDLGSQGKRILLAAHHIAVDGVSWRIILDEVHQTYIQLKNGFEIVHPKRRGNSIQEWALKLEDFSKRIPKEEKAYWSSVYQSKGYRQSFHDFDLGPDYLKNCKVINEELSEEDTSNLLQKANEPYQTKADELMIIALSMALSQYTQDSNVTIEVEGHGREEIDQEFDLSNTVGWFTSMYPVSLTLQDADLSENIKDLKEQLRSIPRKGFSHGILRYISRELDLSQQKLVRFNYLGDFNASFSNGVFSFAREYTGRDNSQMNEMDCLIDIVGYTVDNRLKLSFTYSENKFRPETISHLIGSYKKQLKELIRHCCSKKETVFTPSDFDTADLSSEDLEELFNFS